MRYVRFHKVEYFEIQVMRIRVSNVNKQNTTDKLHEKIPKTFKSCKLHRKYVQSS